MTGGHAPAAGRRVLVVGDDHHAAESLASALEANGVEVIGPVATVAAALGMIAASGSTARFST